MTVIDCTQAPSVDAMRAAGVTGLCRYLSLPQQNTLWKRIQKPEYEALRAAGFTVLLNWEYAATDWLGGASAGTQHAAQAVREAQALGYPAGCAIVGSADFNMTLTQWQTAGRMYALAYSAGLRVAGYRAGVYGPWDVLGWCQQLQMFDVFWQAGMSTAWSGGRNAQLWPGAHLRQRGHITIGGIDCDYNDVLQANYGQASEVAPDSPPPPPPKESTMLGFLTVSTPTVDDPAAQFNLCDGHVRTPKTREEAEALAYVNHYAPDGQKILATGTDPGWLPFGDLGSVVRYDPRTNNYAGLDTPGVDPLALAAALAPHLPPELTADQVAAACAKALAGLTATTVIQPAS